MYQIEGPFIYSEITEVTLRHQKLNWMEDERNSIYSIQFICSSFFAVVIFDTQVTRMWAKWIWQYAEVEAKAAIYSYKNDKVKT